MSRVFIMEMWLLLKYIFFIIVKREDGLFLKRIFLNNFLLILINLLY